MTNSETSSNKPAVLSNWFPIGFLLLSAGGFADATYLTTKHFLGATVPCSILQGCEQVLTSQYSTIAGIPISLLGSLYYLSVMLLAAIYLETRNVSFLKLATLLIGSGFLISLGLVYIQIFIIKNICLYCMWSALTSALLFLLSIIFWKKIKSSKSPTEIPV